MVPRLAWMCVVLMWSAGCATVPRPSTEPPQVTLEGLCGKYALDCAWDGVAQTVTLDYGGKKVQAMVGSALVMVGSRKVTLSAPLRRSQGAVVVPADFEKTVFGLAPSVMPPSVPSVTFLGRRLGKVVLDAGHGGKDPGALGYAGIREKDINLDISQRLARSLRDAGVEVIETRSDDRFVSLDERTVAATEPGVDLFISLHANATKSRNARGIEVFYAGPLTMEDRFEADRQENERKICRLLNMNRERPELKHIVADMLYVHKMASASRLADTVARGMARELGQESRGCKTARFFVLRNTLVPSILIEVGFISSPREALLLKDPEYRQKIADAVAKSLMRYAHASGF